jgi:O-antigen/teichoic acid export membrane protein
MSGVDVTAAPDAERPMAVATPPEATPVAPVADTTHDHVLAKGVAWNGLFRWGAQLVSWSSTILVARLLSPDDYGIVGMATWFMAFAGIVTNFGISTTIMVQRGLPQSTIRQLNLFALLLGVLVALAALGAAPLMAGFYREPRVADVLRMYAITFLLSATVVVPAAIMQRDLRYRASAVLEFSRAITTTAAVVWLALRGHGYWALVWGNIIGTAAYAIAANLLSPVGVSLPRWSVVGGPVRQSGHQMVGSLAWFGYSNADFLVVGRALGATATGVYSFAWSLATLPGEKITNVIQAVVGPFFAALQDDLPALRRYFRLTNRLLASLVFPVFLGFALVSADAVPVIFGEKWRPAIPVLTLLVVYASVQNLYIMLGHILIARGLHRLFSWYQFVWLVILPTSFWLVATRTPYGVVGVATVWVVMMPIMSWYPLRRTLQSIDETWRGYFDALRPPVVSVLAMGAVVLGLRVLLSAAPAPARLGVCVVAGALTYSLVWWFRFREDGMELVRLLRARKDGGA